MMSVSQLQRVASVHVMVQSFLDQLRRIVSGQLRDAATISKECHVDTIFPGSHRPYASGPVSFSSDLQQGGPRAIRRLHNCPTPVKSISRARIKFHPAFHRADPRVFILRHVFISQRAQSRRRTRVIYPCPLWIFI